MTDIRSLVPRTPSTCHWEITAACNLRCRHCMVDAGDPLPDELSTDEALGVCDELAGIGCRTVALTGGEPLLRQDWREIAARLNGRGVGVSVASNGVLVDDRAVEQMIEAGVSGVSVSLDGPEDVHDKIRPHRDGCSSSYSSAVAALGRLSSSSLETICITCINGKNANLLDDIFQIVSGLGIDCWQVQLSIFRGRFPQMQREYLVDPRVIPGVLDHLAELGERGGVRISVGDNLGYYTEVEPRLRRKRNGKPGFWTGCAAGLRALAITPWGGVKGCSALDNSFVTANLRSQSLQQIWDNWENFGPPGGPFQGRLVGGCGKCDFGPICMAGCSATAFGATGTIWDNPFCAKHPCSGGGATL